MGLEDKRRTTRAFKKGLLQSGLLDETGKKKPTILTGLREVY